MKRRFIHVAFWIGYWALTFYLEFLWLKQYADGWSTGKMWARALLSSSLYIIPYIVLSYYLVYYGLFSIVKRKKGLVINLSVILIPYLAAICMVILIARGIVLPFIYEGIVKHEGWLVAPAKFIGIMIEAAFPAAVLMAMKYTDTLLAAKERENILVKEKMNAELQLLKNQLNPHFLFNTLNNIYALTRKKSDLAPDTVIKLSELLSFMLYEANSDTILVQREMQFLEDYIALQKIRFADELTLKFSKEIDDPSQPIAPLLLLPLVENAFKHGASQNHFDSYIHIDMLLNKKQLVFTIENSIEENAQYEGEKNIGLNNTIRQLELIYSEQKLDIVNTKDMFKVQLSINLNSYGKN